VIGLAPAAHGGNRTGRIFTGDRSGDWLFEALHGFGFANQADSTHRMDGLRLTDCYVTAAARCAPPDNKPLKEELFNCRPYLLQELSLLKRLKVVVALGHIAFKTYLACRKERGAPIPGKPLRFGHRLVYHLPEGITLIASYHPSQQNTLTGRLTRPMFHAVFRQARRWIDN
jgi:uracil-DNA glycosylase family 4